MHAYNGVTKTDLVRAYARHAFLKAGIDGRGVVPMLLTQCVLNLNGSFSAGSLAGRRG